ncbi:MAG TPA: hypothetical protein VNR87_10510 [Flavisolibacter sp.]|nr:hypothetical protein [Flavisolibacter sp.]
MDEDVFEVRVNATGASYMMQITRIVKFMYVCSFAMSVFYIFSLFFRYVAYSRLMYRLPPIARLQVYTSYIYIFIISLLLPVQIYYYLRFCKGVNAAMDYADSGRLNESFTWLLKHAIISLMILAVNFLMGIFNLIADYELFRMLQNR